MSSEDALLSNTAPQTVTATVSTHQEETYDDDDDNPWENDLTGKFPLHANF